MEELFFLRDQLLHMCSFLSNHSNTLNTNFEYWELKYKLFEDLFLELISLLCIFFKYPEVEILSKLYGMKIDLSCFIRSMSLTKENNFTFVNTTLGSDSD